MIEGNFAAVAHLAWNSADVLIWIDPPLAVSWWNIARRSVRQMLGRESGDWRSAYVGKRALLRTVTRKHRNNRPKYERKAAEAQRAGARLVRLRSRAAARTWFAGALPALKPGAPLGENH